MADVDVFGVVARVRPGSPSAKAGIKPGDRLLTLGGHPLVDILDYRFHTAATRVELTYLSNEGKDAPGRVVEVVVDKEFDEDFGLEFTSSGLEKMRTCKNKCVFCFVDQLPGGVRQSLRVKDDDYVHSFLNGNYISLTNLSDDDIDRIIRLRLTPVYVSVHSTEPDLRVRLMGNPKAAGVMNQLARLAAGVVVHAQLVLVPGINDGAHLDRSLADLFALGEGLASVAVVPVGLTAHREGLPELRAFTQAEARDVVARVESFQAPAMKARGNRFVYASDELYLAAGLPVPPDEAYDDYPQLDNGVGLVRQFLDSFELGAEDLARRMKAKARAGKPAGGVKAVVATGVSAAPIIAKAVRSLPPAFDVRVVGVVNRFFGPSVTVAGLLVGEDISQSLKAVLPDAATGCDFVVIPDVCVKEGLFLDGMTVEALAQAVGLPVVVAKSTGQGLIDALTSRFRPDAVPFGKKATLVVTGGFKR